LSHVDYYCGGPLLEDDHPMVIMVGTRGDLVCFQNTETQYYAQLAKLNPPVYIKKTCFSCAACAADDGVDDYVRDHKAIYEGIMPVCIKCKDLGIYGYRKESKINKRVLAEEHHGEKKMEFIMKR
jgi:hypothetical protein